MLPTLIRISYGYYRTYNKEIFTIILNFIRPPEKHMPLPKCSFFEIYEDHGVHHALIKFYIIDPVFPENPELVIQSEFQNGEDEFLR